MNPESVRLASVTAALVLVASCLVFTAPGIQAESALSVAAVEVEADPEVEATDVDYRDDDPVPDAPVEVESSPSPAVQQTVQPQVRMIAGHNGIMIVVPVFDTFTDVQPTAEEEPSDTVLTEEYGCVTGSSADEVHYAPADEGSDSSEDIEVPSPRDEVRLTEPGRSVSVLVFDASVLHDLLFAMLLSPILESDENVYHDDDADVDTAENPEPTDFEPVEDEAGDDEPSPPPSEPEPLPFFHIRCANAPCDTLRVETVLAGLD